MGPVTDLGKRSKRGRLAPMETEQGLQTFDSSVEIWPAGPDFLSTVFLNGELVVKHDWDDIKGRALA